jgi:putative ABC transport system permease protein
MFPPRAFRSWLRRLAPRDVRESLLADLDDGFERRWHERGPRPARRWYRRQVIAGVAPLIRMRVHQRRVPSLLKENSMTSLDALLQDLRYAIRLLWRSPSFTLPALATLALGLGATTAIFSVVHGVILTPLPYSSPNGIVTVWQDMRARGGPEQEWATPGNLADWSAERTLFSAVASIRQWPTTLTGQGEPEPILGEQVTRAYFDVLGVQPAMGRGFREDEAVPNGPRVVVLSHGTWLRRFGGDADVIGRKITLNGEPHEIVGVMPAGFRPVIVGNAEMWRPERFNLVTPARGAVVLRVVARLAPGVSVERARAQAATLAGTLETRHPEFNKGVGIGIAPLQDQVVSDIRPALIVLSGAVLFVLLIASVNVANLLLARASNRTRELGVRMALGASRKRVVRQLLTESLLLAGVGGLIGVGVALLGIQALVAFAPAGLPRIEEIGLSARVLLFAGAMTTLTGVLFGLVPALQGSRDRGPAAVTSSARGAVGGPGRRTRRLLIIAEVAVALVLLVGGGLLFRTFVALQKSDLGFDPTDVTVGLVIPPAVRYPDMASRIAFYDQVLERARSVPGVKTAALSSVIPLTGGDSDMDFEIEGAGPPRSPNDSPVTWYRVVSAGYFDAMGIRTVRGRFLAPRDPNPEVVINETLAKAYWPGQDAIGRRVRFAPDGPWFAIVGIAGDVKYQGARGESRNQMFIPYWHFAEGGINVVLKAQGSPERLVRPLKDAVAQVDKDVPVSRIAPMTQLLAASIERPRFLAVLVVLFAGLAAVLSAVGILGVMSYLVAQRTSEIAVRVALGARSREVLWLVLGDAVRLAGIGVAIGLGASLLLTPSFGTLLYGVSPFDPLTLALTSAALLAVACLASALPARRAARVSPVEALKNVT